MSSRGKGGKRRRTVFKDNIEGVTKPAIRRLARRGGVKRISGEVYVETRKTLSDFLNETIKNAIAYTEHGRRKTVSATDIVLALKMTTKPMTLYGIDEKRKSIHKSKKSKATRKKSSPKKKKCKSKTSLVEQTEMEHTPKAANRSVDDSEIVYPQLTTGKGEEFIWINSHTASWISDGQEFKTVNYLEDPEIKTKKCQVAWDDRYENVPCKGDVKKCHRCTGCGGWYCVEFCSAKHFLTSGECFQSDDDDE